MNDEPGGPNLARLVKQPEFLEAHADLVAQLEAYIQGAIVAVGDDEQAIQGWLTSLMATDTELRTLITRMEAEQYILDRLQQEEGDR